MCLYVRARTRVLRFYLRVNTNGPYVCEATEDRGEDTVQCNIYKYTNSV